MPIYQYTFPIPQTYIHAHPGWHQLFILAEKCPTKEQLRDKLIALVGGETKAAKDGFPEVGEIFPVRECLACMMKLEGRFPVLEGKVIETYTMVRTRWGMHPLTVKLVEPLELDAD